MVLVRKCAKCPQEIVWVSSAASGKPMPLNYPPEKRVVIGRSGDGYVVDTYVPHFSTCPFAESFRGS